MHKCNLVAPISLSSEDHIRHKVRVLLIVLVITFTVGGGGTGLLPSVGLFIIWLAIFRSMMLGIGPWCLVLSPHLISPHSLISFIFFPFIRYGRYCVCRSCVASMCAESLPQDVGI